MKPKNVKLKYQVNLLLFFLIFVVHNLQAQETKVTRDLELWTELTIKKEIFKKVEISTSQHLRFFENAGALDDYIAELGVLHLINKNFAIGANGRYTKDNKHNGLSEDKYRYDFDFRYDTNLSNNLKFYYRLKYQKEFYNSSVFNKFLNYYETTFRHRGKVAWKKNDKHRFYSSIEIFRLTKKSRDPYYSKYRFFLGDNFSAKVGDIDFSVGIARQLSSENPYNCFICKLKYEFEW